jgi:hypothetical protein
MIKVYINYPTAHITIHGSPNCALIRSHHVQHQRRLTITPDTLEMELAMFENGGYIFNTADVYRDMWLEIDLADRDAEMSTAKEIWRKLCRRYTGFNRAEPKVHC